MLKNIHRFIISLAIVAFVIVQIELFKSRRIDYNLFEDDNDNIQYGNVSSFIKYRLIDGYTSIDLASGNSYQFKLLVVNKEKIRNIKTFYNHTSEQKFDFEELNVLVSFLFAKGAFLFDINILRDLNPHLQNKRILVMLEIMHNFFLNKTLSLLTIVFG